MTRGLVRWTRPSQPVNSDASSRMTVGDSTSLRRSRILSDL
jgi:hypothetical protein